MTDPNIILAIEAFAAIPALVLAARYLHRSDKPKRRDAPARHYNHTYYNIEKAVFINAQPNSSTFQLGRNGGIPLPAVAVKPLPYWRQRMLEEGRPFKNAPEAEKQAFARQQDMIMRGYA